MSCACFYCMAAKWGWGVGRGGGGRGMTSVCLAYDGDISLKIRIKPPKNYLSVELNKQSHKSYSGFYCTKKMLTLNAISNSGATLETRKTWTEFTFARTVTRDREKIWPIADQRVHSDDPRGNCGTHFGSGSQFPSRR